MGHILVVDDDPEIRKLLQRTLKEKFPSIKVIEADSGLAAAVELRKNELDLVISDGQMDRGDGFWLYHFIQQYFEQMPLIIFTATPSEFKASTNKTLKAVVSKGNMSHLLEEVQKVVGAQPVSFSEFKFSSLHKYITPLYAELSLHQHQPEALKRVIVSKTIRDFYRRIREYRELTLDAVSDCCKIPLSDLEAFDRGERDHDKDLIFRYVRACGADQEHALFIQKIMGFKDPNQNTDVEELAKSAFHQGFILPGVDYRKIFSPKGKVLQFSKKRRSDE